MRVTIREEKKADHNRVEIMTREAFWKDDKLQKDNIGATEHYLVHLLRDGFVPDKLNLVATMDNKIVGHIMLATGSYVTDGNTQTDVLCLGPLTVDPRYQRQGIGTRLIKEGIKRAQEMNYPAIMLYGHPSYYPKFGFQNAEIYDITTKEGKNFDAFMALELYKDALSDISGKFIMHSIYEEEEWLQDAILFDKQAKFRLD